MAGYDIVFCSSSGGHFEQLMMLRPLMSEYKTCIISEKVNYKVEVKGIPLKFITGLDRNAKFFIPKLIKNCIEAIFYLLRLRPKVIVSTGALASVPLLFFGKLFGAKIMYIESFAKISSPGATGKFIYRFADKFYIQWEDLRKFYPNAKHIGGIY